jgi:hypothetical protein
MSADKLVFDLSQEIEGTPQVFIKKDWLSILDNMNTNYSSNQTIIDTSQLSNSNKYMSYREAYLAVPLLLTLSSSTSFVAGTDGDPVPAGMDPTASVSGAGTVPYPTGCDYAIGLKNWFGSVFHSLTLDMNGTTIIQQTPLINMVNSFRLMTTLSWNDVITQGSTIGFYPDSATSWTITGSPAVNYSANHFGMGVCNNTLFPSTDVPFTASIDTAGLQTFLSGSANTNLNTFQAGSGNKGFLKRIQYINMDLEAPAGWVGTSTSAGDSRGATPVPVTGLVKNWDTQWNSYISQKGLGVIQTSIMATVYLKHLHNFFAMCPLLKGTFFKLTCFLNNGSANFTITDKNFTVTTMTTAVASNLGNFTAVTSSVPVGGVLPFMIAEGSYIYGGSAGLGQGNYTASLAVGSRVLATHTVSGTGVAIGTGKVSQSIYLYVPSYTFNPVFENAYLSSPVKSIKYSDYYQYQVVNVGTGGQFNNLLTNGIANIKSVLILPFYSASTSTGAQKSGLPAGMPVYQSPFDPAGTGPTSPLCMFSNFNVVISGQNAIYNTERYNFEQFNNQFKGINAVNGDMTDGLTSGLLTSQDWQREYCYWYVNVARMLPVEESVPKSVQIIGQNNSGFDLDLVCFIEYGVSVDVDVLTGARV